MINIAIIGIGLIGGSIATDLKKYKKIKKIIGVDHNIGHLRRALDLGLIHEAMSLDMAVKESDVILISTPVDVSIELLPKILSMVKNQVVFDVGSTKTGIVESVLNHSKRGRYVATHPMAGTEFSGPDAAVSNLFRNKTVIFCDQENSDDDALELISDLYQFLGMNLIHMDTDSHDLHAAYVSHISHISSFALALTVLEKEKYEKNILAMASGGFDSTVRLAKSSPEMWTPILIQNAKNIATVLDSYIATLQNFKAAILTQNRPEVHKLINQSNEIKKVLDQSMNRIEFCDFCVSAK
jgi:prephenate dehydrogenase